MGVSTTTVRKLVRNHRAGRPDSVEVRRAMVERLATDILGFTLTDEGVTPLVLVAEICDSCRVDMFGW